MLLTGEHITHLLEYNRGDQEFSVLWVATN